MSRYQRQTCLPEMGEIGQEKIASAHVLVVGAGGLGCAVLPYLVGAGVGHISLVDGDFVSLSNLHRQVLYRKSDIDLPKVECAKHHLESLNDDSVITTYFTFLTPTNVVELCDGMDLVLDCADNFAVSYMLSDYCYEKSIPLVSASALGFEGYVGGFCGGKPSLRAVFPELPQRAKNCSSAGVMGPVVGSIGCIQGQFALNLILGTTPSPLGQLLSINLQTLRQSAFRFDDAPEPATDQYLGFIGRDDITPQDWVVDLRGQTNTAGVQYLSLDDFLHHQPQPPYQEANSSREHSSREHSSREHKQRAVLVCRTGLTAWRAARRLQNYWQGQISLIALGDDPL